MIYQVFQWAGWALAAVGGTAGIVAAAKVGPERAKIRAEAYRAGVDSAQVLSATALSLLQPALDQVAFLRTELAEALTERASLRKSITELEKKVAVLRADVVALRVTLAKGAPQ